MIRKIFSSKNFKFCSLNDYWRWQKTIQKGWNEKWVYYFFFISVICILFFCDQRRNIEILKIRFGEAALQVCEVMLRDMTDSKRIDGHVQSQRAVSYYFVKFTSLKISFFSLQKSIVHPTIISRHFWPSLETSEMIMPGQFQQFVFSSLALKASKSKWSCILLCLFRLQTDYAHEFTVFKPDKKLKWLPHLGTVQLELQLEDRVVDVDVPPLEAAFIELFSQKGNDFL